MSAFSIQHRLGFVLRFEDIFDRPTTPRTPPIRTRLHVSIPDRRWDAMFIDHDGTYRFRFHPDEDITGNHTVEVTSLDGFYLNHETFTVTLPRVASTPPVATDYMIPRPLWPTRLFRIPVGETAVIGRIVPAVPGLDVTGLRVQLYRGLAPPPAGAYTFTDSQGEFVFRLKKLGGPVPGGTLNDIKIVVSDGAPVSVAPAIFTVELGRTQTMTFTRT